MREPGKNARDTTLALLARRAPEATVCPSEVAKAMASAAGEGASDWRSAMPAVHAEIDRLIVEGRVHLSWKGELLTERGGPYRIGEAKAGDRRRRSQREAA